MRTPHAPASHGFKNIGEGDGAKFKFTLRNNSDKIPKFEVLPTTKNTKSNFYFTTSLLYINNETCQHKI